MTHRSLARKGRACLLWGAAAFVAVQLGWGLMIDQAFPEVRDPEYADRLGQFRALRAEEPDAPLAALLGSSRTWMGVRAARLGVTVGGRPALAYNFAWPGGGPVRELLTLRRLLADGARPDRVVVEVMPPYLNDRPGMLPEERHLDGATLQGPELARACRYVSRPWSMAARWGLGRTLPWRRRNLDLRIREEIT